ncbi:MAG: helix-turn-helix domain-containing protein [Clostridia bacterium]|nr:helix-turn-helix domain-containing protein [Clostridia bacterium]
MKDLLISKLAEISKNESEILISGDITRKDFFAKSGKFIIERRRMADISLGVPTASICIHPHLIFDAFPAHTHDFIELMYVCSGSITHVIGNKHIRLETGDIILMGRATRHSILPTTEKDIGLNVIISADYIDTLLTELGKSAALHEKIFERLLNDDELQYCVFKTADIGPITNIIENLAYAIIDDNMKDSFIMQTSINLLFAYLASTPNLLSDFSNMNTYAELTKRKILNYIETSYQTASLGEAAQMLGLSEAHLSRWIKQNFGISFKEMLCNKRFDTAKNLLLNTNMPISDVIVNVGYENSSYFHKQFLKRFGTTPKGFRNQYKK